MLTDPKEIEIISKAKQPNVRNKARSREVFVNIFEDFFEGVRLDGDYVDMGPGQFDFGELIRKQGGSCFGIDNDPAVIELGRYKGFEVAEMNLRSLASKPIDRHFDGVFNKFTFNAFWSWEDERKHRELVQIIPNLMKADAWAWIAPWNGVPKNKEIDDAAIERTLLLQRRYFEDIGFATHALTDAQKRRYGVGGRVANHVVFTKNLRWRPAA